MNYYGQDSRGGQNSNVNDIGPDTCLLTAACCDRWLWQPKEKQSEEMFGDLRSPPLNDDPLQRKQAYFVLARNVLQHSLLLVQRFPNFPDHKNYVNHLRKCRSPSLHESSPKNPSWDQASVQFLLYNLMFLRINYKCWSCFKNSEFD